MNLFTKLTYLKNFNQNLLINYFATFAQLSLGFLIFLTIIIYKNTAYLGVFSQLYTIFIVYGLIASLGINESILSKLSLTANIKKRKDIIVSALICTLINATIFSILLSFSSKIINNFFDSSDLTNNINILSIATFFFIFNKTFFSIYNALKFFNFFAFLQFFRPLLMFLTLILLISLKTDAEKIGIIFLFSEIIIFLINIVYIFFLFKIKKIYIDFINLVSHYKFGIKVFFNSFFSESFIRIDIIFLGFFLSDENVGIYAFASLFFEGVYQFSIVIRNVLNPDLGKLYIQNRFKKLIKLTKYCSKISILIISVASFFIILFYPLLKFIIDSNLIEQSFALLKILLFGGIVYSIIVPEENIFFQIKKPAIQSLYMLTIVSVNIFLNIFLIPRYGLSGAAIATLISFVSTILIFNVYLILFTKLKYGLFIVPNKLKN